MNFGCAIEALKNGMKVAREGWNGKGMFVYYVPEGEYKTQTEVAKKDFGETAHYNPYLAIKTVSGSISTWVPSINDCLAEDWQIIDSEKSTDNEVMGKVAEAFLRKSYL